MGKLKGWQLAVAAVALLWVGEQFKLVSMLLGMIPGGKK